MKAYCVSLKSTAVFFAGIALYRLFLDKIYFTVLAPIYSYAGFNDYSTNTNLLLSWLLLFLFYVAGRGIFYSKTDVASCMVLYILSLLAFVPFTTCVYAGILSSDLIMSFCLYWIVLLCLQKLLLKVPVSRFPKLKISNFVLDERAVRTIGILSILLVFYISFVYTGFRLHFSLMDVYDLRLEARGFGMPTVLTYLFSWTKAVNPILMAYCLIKKYYAVAFLFFFSQIVSFGIDGAKAPFLMTFVIFLVILFLKDKITTDKIKNMILCGFITLAIISYAEYLLFNTCTISTLFIRRILFVPRYLDYCYFDFFLDNEPDFFRSSFLRHLGFVSPYSELGRGISFIIGAQYFNRPEMNCNNGFFSDAITNLGTYGVLIMPVLYIIVLRFLDKSTLNLNRRLVFTPISFFALSINSSFIFTSLLTHGFFVLLLIFSFMTPESDVKSYS